MLSQILKLLIDVVFGLVTYALLLRFLMQLLRAPFRNPLGQAVIALTDWIVKPLRRVIPGAGGYDWASLVAAWLAQAAWLVALFAVFGAGFTLLSGGGLGYVAVAALLRLAEVALWILIVAVVAQAILSWVAPDGPLSGLLNALTFPFLRPIRRVLPPIGGTLDLSPLVVIVLAQIALMGVQRLGILVLGAFALA
ncbi:MAG: YggT family protein [Proteobacteria bacterium]|nr:YggT family protein [Pseudomonadota bacterium]